MHWNWKTNFEPLFSQQESKINVSRREVKCFDLFPMNRLMGNNWSAQRRNTSRMKSIDTTVMSGLRGVEEEEEEEIEREEDKVKRMN